MYKNTYCLCKNVTWLRHSHTTFINSLLQHFSKRVGHNQVKKYKKCNNLKCKLRSQSSHKICFYTLLILRTSRGMRWIWMRDTYVCLRFLVENIDENKILEKKNYGDRRAMGSPSSIPCQSIWYFRWKKVAKGQVLSQSTSAFPCHYHSIKATCSLTYHRRHVPANDSVVKQPTS